MDNPEKLATKGTQKQACLEHVIYKIKQYRY